MNNMICQEIEIDILISGFTEIFLFNDKKNIIKIIMKKKNSSNVKTF